MFVFVFLLHWLYQLSILPSMGRKKKTLIRDLTCTIPGCEMKQQARGWCSTHYCRWFKYGDPNKILRRPNGQGTKDDTGYSRITTPDGRRIRRHRYVMEQKLGRRLKRSEHVHHIDGDKSNNDPDNLTLTNVRDHRKIHSKYYRDDKKKECRVCRVVKDRSEFYVQRSRPNRDPNAPHCKSCNKFEARKWKALKRGVGHSPEQQNS